MSFATNVDFVGPKSAQFVTISDAAVVPAATNISVAITGGTAIHTITGSAYTFGKINVIQFHPVTNFTGTSAANLTFSIATLGIPLPEQTVYAPSINTMASTTQIGYISIDTAGTAIITAVSAGTGFTTGSQSTIYSTVVMYASA